MAYFFILARTTVVDAHHAARCPQSVLAARDENPNLILNISGSMRRIESPKLL